MQSVLKFAIAGVAVLLMSLGPVPGGWSAYLESDTETANPDDHVGAVRESRRRSEDNPVTRLVRQIEVGHPYRYRQLTIFPLYRRAMPVLADIKTLDEAMDNRWMIIREKDRAQVSEVTVRNESRHYVFLMAGELIVGGRQNRLIRDDVLLPPHSSCIDVAVYCSEQERWATQTDGFNSPKCLAHTELRYGAARGAAQRDIWAEVDAQSDKADVCSSTRDYRRIYDNPSLKRELDDYADRFREGCRADTVGTVAVAGTRILGCDLFGDPALCTKLWNKLMRAHALDAIYRSADEHGTLVERDVERFLEAAYSAHYDERHGAGVGDLMRISGAMDGVALIWEGRVVHAALFGEYRIKLPDLGEK